MTRKDYIRIAEILSALPDPHRFAMADAFAGWLAQDNPRFERQTFIATCVGYGKKKS